MPSTVSAAPSTPHADCHDGIFEVLKREHRQMAQLMAQIADEASEDARGPRFETLYRTLHPHMKGEEETVYVSLMEAEPTRPITMEGVQEHRVAASLLSELRAMATHGETWVAKFKVLKESVEHHVEEEEEKMFPKGRKALSVPGAEALARAFERARDAHLANLGAPP